MLSVWRLRNPLIQAFASLQSIVDTLLQDDMGLTEWTTPRPVYSWAAVLSASSTECLQCWGPLASRLSSPVAPALQTDTHEYASALSLVSWSWNPSLLSLSLLALPVMVHREKLLWYDFQVIWHLFLMRQAYKTSFAKKCWATSNHSKKGIFIP